jgi:Ser-tRNA(Ala) deacylase AlaX
MTEALYLIDSYQETTSAVVTAVGDTYLILDQSIFYPQGGGPPSDKGQGQSDTRSSMLNPSATTQVRSSTSVHSKVHFCR